MTAQALTDQAFWDNFWAGVTVPTLIDPRVQWQFTLAQLFRRLLPKERSLNLFEVGCAPGRWMIWFAREMGYAVSGCDSSARGIQLTAENLKMNGVSGRVYVADLLSDELPWHSFDVVISLGVIEHFDDPRLAVARHVQLLKPGGTLVLEVPNMAGGLNNALLRAAGMQELVGVHNLRTMQRTYFESLARDLSLNNRFLGYVGGFDPGLIVYNHDSQKHGRRTVWLPFWIVDRIFNRVPICRHILAHFNHPAFSHMLLGIFASSVQNKKCAYPENPFPSHA